MATLVSSKTRSVQTGLSEVLHWSAPPPAEGGGSNQVSRPLSRSMGGERDANLFCGSYSAWGTQSVNPLSRPGHKCARCNKDYGARVFEEEDRDEMFDFPHFFGGVIMFVAKHFIRIKIQKFLAKPKYTFTLYRTVSNLGPFGWQSISLATSLSF